MSADMAPLLPGGQSVPLDPQPPAIAHNGLLTVSGPSLNFPPAVTPPHLPDQVLVSIFKGRVPADHLNMLELYMGLDTEPDGQFKQVASSLNMFVELMKRLQDNGHLSDVKIPTGETVGARMGKMGEVMVHYLPDFWAGVEAKKFLLPIKGRYPVRCGWTDMAVAARPLLARLLGAMGVQRWVTLLPPQGLSTEAA